MNETEETVLRAAATFVLTYAGDIEVEAMDYADNITRKYPSIRPEAVVDTDRHAKEICSRLAAVVAGLEAAGFRAEVQS